MMSCGVSHQCLTIDMQRMFCQRSTLRVGSSCYILLYPWSDGAPQRCQWMPLCSVALSPHVSLAKYLFMAFEKIHKIIQNPNPTYSKYHLVVLSCHSSVHMAHSKSSSNLSPSLFFHSLCTQIIPSLHPLSPPAVSGAPGHRCLQHPRRRPRRGAAPRRRRCRR